MSVVADVITVGDFALQNRIGGYCQFSSVLLDQKGHISNALLFVNATVRVPSGCTNVDVSVIDSAYGVLENISVTGSVNVEFDQKQQDITF